MKELFEIFEELGLPYFRQGTLSDDNYPDSFFTFSNFDTPNTSFYDNYGKRYIEKVSVGFYTNDPSFIYSKMNEFIEKAKAREIVVEGRGSDAPSGKENYYGRKITINIIHNS